MRVLHVIPGDPSNQAVMLFAKRQVASLERAGIVGETAYLSSRTDPRILARDGVMLRQIARRFRPDVIHAHYGTVTALLCAGISPAPVVITFRGSDLNGVETARPARAALARFFSQCAALGAARIICVSNRLKQRLWWRSDRAAVIPTGVDLELFHPRPRDDARRELGWSLNEPVVLFNAGHNPRTKRLDLAQAGFERAQESRRDLRLEIMRGDTSPARIPLLLCAADCLLVTSDFEGSPNIVKEALACDLPVVSVDVGDVAERLRGVTPSRVVARTPDAIAAALIEVIASGRRCNGVAAVRELSEDRIAERIVAVYREAARGVMPLTLLAGHRKPQ